ncbi:unnamed protein product [Staurois parvus]|uniref:Uncharacterized protein n=1 Tax=Staurois parvus TaxID=386267 RepID=A0ABN9DJ10_9NEOB|nr:unnamed protein product [Staurois parvus]
MSSTPLCQSLHWPPLSVLHPPLPIPPLASTQCPPSLSANPSTSHHSVSSTPLCQSLHWPPLSVLHPSLPIPPLASTQCPPPPSANPSTGLHSVSSTNLCQSLHWPPLSVLHPPLPIPPLASDCTTYQIQNPITDVQSRPPYCPELHHRPNIQVPPNTHTPLLTRPPSL